MKILIINIKMEILFNLNNTKIFQNTEFLLVSLQVYCIFYFLTRTNGVKFNHLNFTMTCFKPFQPPVISLPALRLVIFQACLMANFSATTYKMLSQVHLKLFNYVVYI